MTNPTVSVLMPTYNAETYIEEAIRSVLNQDFESVEVIVLDDASEDQTYHVASMIEDERVVVHENEENQGIARSRNRLIELASGEYVAWLDSDDRMIDGRLERQVDFLEDNEAYGAIGGDLRLIDRDGERIGRRTYPSTDGAIRRVILRYNPFAQPAMMIRRQILIDLDGFREDMDIGEDYDLMLRVAKEHKVANADELLTEYRVFDEQTTTANMKRTIQNTIRIQRRAIKQYGYEDTWLSWLHRFGLAGCMLLPRRVVQWLFSTVFIDEAS